MEEEGIVSLDGTCDQLAVTCDQLAEGSSPSNFTGKKPFPIFFFFLSKAHTVQRPTKQGSQMSLRGRKGHLIDCNLISLKKGLISSCVSFDFFFFFI